MHECIFDALNDYRKAWSERRIWLMLSIRSFSHSYRRTVLGPWWYSVDQLLYTFGFAAMSSFLFGGKFSESFAYVGVGIAVFSTMSQSVLLGLQSFVGQASLRNSGLSLSGRLVKDTVCLSITFGFRLWPICLVIPFTAFTLNEKILLLVPISFIAASSSIFSGLILAILCSRFRDLSPVINLILKLAFFATPVFWHPDLGVRSDVLSNLASANVFAQYLELIRSPILGLVPSLYTIVYCLIFLAAVFCVATSLLGLLIKKIPYWIG